MNLPSRLSLFSVAAFGAIGFCFAILFYRVLIQPGAWDYIPRVFGSLLAPVPVILFLGYIFANREMSNGREESSPIWVLLCLLVTLATTLGLAFLLRDSLRAWFGEALPLLVVSSVFSASLINFIAIRNAYLGAVLCGVGTAVATGVIFIT
ncbi:MAG: hypothetical protein AAF236_08240 [Verrucomicrobiota bacterium]